MVLWSLRLAGLGVGHAGGGHIERLVGEQHLPRELIHDVLLVLHLHLQDDERRFLPGEFAAEIGERGQEAVVQDHALEDPVVPHQPGLVDFVRRGNIVGDQDDRRCPVERFTDKVAALQLVEQVGDGKLVVRVADFAGAGRLEFAALLGRDLKAVLVAIFLCGLDHGLPLIALRVPRIHALILVQMRAGIHIVDADLEAA